MVGKISTIILFVKDVKKSAEFYRDVLGLKIIGKIIDPGWTEIDCGSCVIGLHKYSLNSKNSKVKKDTGVKIVFGVKNIEKTKALIEKRGCKMGKIVEFGNLKFCDARDPDGNKFQISNRRM